ncbi:MAG: DinB family protein, partial [Crocinitomicaceae bacterium]
WEKALNSLEEMSNEQWENEPVELLIEGKSFITLPRMHMMWFFHNDIIHHRGQLSSYIRPMGGKNPAVYGYSADTV